MVKLTETKLKVNNLESSEENLWLLFLVLLTVTGGRRFPERPFIDDTR